MSTIKLNDHVRYQGRAGRTCVGTVTKLYSAYYYRVDGERLYSPAAAAVRVDSPPPTWWPYGSADTFVPDLAELTLIFPPSLNPQKMKLTPTMQALLLHRCARQCARLTR